MYLALFALMALAVVAGVVWLLTLMLWLRPSTRSLARKAAAGMAGALPGVLCSQLLCVPVVAGALWLVKTVFGFERFSDRTRDTLAFVAVAVPALAALWGFAVGWRTAWSWAAGGSWRQALGSTWVLGPILHRLGWPKQT